MAIEYSKVGWDVAPYKYANPDNMNKMDTGIKAAVDAVNALENVPSDLARNGYGEQSGGANIWDEKWELGSFDASGNKTSATNMIRSVNRIKVKPNTTYHETTGSIAMVLQFYASSGAFISSTDGYGTFTTPSNCEYVAFRMSTSYGTTYKNDIAIIEGTSGSYVSYYESNKTLTTEVAEMENLKVLGWTIPMAYSGSRNYVDSSRQLHVKVGRVDLGELSWTHSTEYFVCNTLSGFKAKADIYCSKYKTRVIAGWTEMQDKEIAMHPSESNIMRVKDSSYTDATAFRTAMSGVYLYYELSTEYVIPCDGSEIVNDQECLKYLGWTVPKQLSVKNVAKNGGGLIQRVGRVDLGTLSWSGSSSFQSSDLVGKAKAVATSVMPNMYSGGITVVKADNFSSADTAICIGADGRLWAKKSGISDATAFRSAMSGVYLYYELSSAVEIGEGKEKSSHTIGTFGVTTINGAMAITSVTSGSLPPNNNTFFTIVSNGSTNSHNTSLHYDSNTLYIVSDKAQNVLVKWINFSA